MMRIRVLVVDDSVVVRRVLTEILQSDREIEVAATAATASIALQKLSQVVPDVVLLDVEMPEMDGIEAAGKMRAGWPRLPIIMCSTLTERGADITFRALAAGASDYVAKPSSLGGGANIDDFRKELVGKVRALGARRAILPPAVGSGATWPPPPTVAPPLRVRRQAPIEAVAMGSSTGGPNALATVFSALPSDLPVPIFIAQHMPPLFTRILADRLAASSRIRVTEGVDGRRVEPGWAYVAPGNHHMTVVRDASGLLLALDQDPAENSCRPAIDPLFRSVARVFGAGALGVVLTGMGHDGARGATHIVQAGGSVFVQDAATCVVASMPRAVVELGMADAVLPIDEVGVEIVRRLRRQGFRPSAVPRAEGWK